MLEAAEKMASILPEYSLGYTDDELVSLRDCKTGMGEIGEWAAIREIERRAAIAAYAKAKRGA